MCLNMASGKCVNKLQCRSSERRLQRLGAGRRPLQRWKHRYDGGIVRDICCLHCHWFSYYPLKFMA